MLKNTNYFLHAPITLMNDQHIILGDSWNYMAPNLVPSSTKRIATRILVTAKLNRILFSEVVFLIWSFPANHYLFKVCYWSTRTRCENCSKLRTKTQERRHYRSGIFIINCEHISRYVLTVGSHSKWPAVNLHFYRFCSLEDLLYSTWT